MLWLCEPNHGAARCAAIERRYRLNHEKILLILCQQDFILLWGRYYINNYLSLLRSLFHQRWQGCRSLCDFLPNEKRRKTACVFAYVVFFILNPIQEASASFSASTGASTDASVSSSTRTPKVLISGNRSRNQLLMTGYRKLLLWHSEISFFSS